MCPAKLRCAHPSHSLSAAGPSRSRGHGRPRFCRGTHRTDCCMKNKYSFLKTIFYFFDGRGETLRAEPARPFRSHEDVVLEADSAKTEILFKF